MYSIYDEDKYENDFYIERGFPIFYLENKPIYRYKNKLYDENGIELEEF